MTQRTNPQRAALLTPRPRPVVPTMQAIRDGAAITVSLAQARTDHEALKTHLRVPATFLWPLLHYSRSYKADADWSELKTLQLGGKTIEHDLVSNTIEIKSSDGTVSTIVHDPVTSFSFDPDFSSSLPEQGVNGLGIPCQCDCHRIPGVYHCIACCSPDPKRRYDEQQGVSND